MQTLEAIRSRASIRRFDSTPVKSGQLETMLDAAMCAPSAGNASPWHFITVRDRARLNQIAERHSHAKMAAQAPLAVVICADTEAERFPGNWPMDCAAATQNLLLAAHEQGLGAVWCGIWPDDSRVAVFRELFVIPEKVVPVAVVVIGHPAERKERKDRFDRGRIHAEIWRKG